MEFLKSFVNNSPVLREHETKVGLNVNVDISSHFADGRDLAQIASCYKLNSKVGHKCSIRDFKSTAKRHFVLSYITFL